MNVQCTNILHVQVQVSFRVLKGSHRQFRIYEWGIYKLDYPPIQLIVDP